METTRGLRMEIECNGKKIAVMKKKIVSCRVKPRRENQSEKKKKKYSRVAQGFNWMHEQVQAQHLRRK